MNNEVPEIIKEFRSINNGKPLDVLNDVYDTIDDMIRKSEKMKSYDEMIDLCEKSLPLIEPMIIWSKMEMYFRAMAVKNADGEINYDEKSIQNKIQKFLKENPDFSANDELKGMDFFVVGPVTAIDRCAEFYAVMEMDDGLNILKDVVHYFKNLDFSQKYVDECYTMMNLSKKIKGFIKKNPGYLKNKMKKALGYDNTDILTKTIDLMEMYGLIKKEPGRNSSQLFLC